MANTQPLIIMEGASEVRTARGSPNPTKYGQLHSMYVSRFGAGHPVTSIPKKQHQIEHEDTPIVHFTVTCLAAKPLNKSEAQSDLVMIQTLLLFKCNFLCYDAR